MDEVIVEMEKTKIEWEDTYEKTIQHIKAIQEYEESRRGNREKKISLQGLNILAQDGLSLLNSLQFNIDLLAPQLPSDDHVQSTLLLLQTWKNQYHRYFIPKNMDFFVLQCLIFPNVLNNCLNLLLESGKDKWVVKLIFECLTDQS